YVRNPLRARILPRARIPPHVRIPLEDRVRGLLEHLLALAARQDAELLAVLRDGAAGDVDAALLEQLDDLLVRMRALGILAGDQLLDLGLDRLRCEVL